MLQTHPANSSLEVLSDPVEAYIGDLFDPSPQAEHWEQKIDEKILKTAYQFLRHLEASTDIELNELIAQFKEAKLTAESVNFDEYLDRLTETVVTHSIHISSPRFIGHMTSALPHFMRPLAKLMTALNQNVVKTETAKAFTPYERQALGILHRSLYHYSDEFYDRHLQNPHSTLGIVVSGGTSANLTAMWCARNAALGPKNGFQGIEKEGAIAALNFYGYQGQVIIGSSLMHYSFDKTVDLMGLGSGGLIRIPADRHNRIDCDRLRETVAECQAKKQHIIAIVGIAGTTDSGGIDPLEEMAAIAREAKVHFHVDAAWGGPLIFSQQHRHKLAGIELADSVTIDAHKQLYAPMGIGMVMFRNPQQASAIEKHASYTVREGSADLGQRSLEGSRPAMSLFLHAGLHAIGLKGYEFLIDEGIRKTQYMADRVRSRPEFELLAEPEINLLIYRYIPEQWLELVAQGQLTIAQNQAIDRFNEQLQKAQRHAGRTFIARTITKSTRYGSIPIVALRAAIANPLTTEADIDAVLDDQVAIAATLNLP